MNFANLIAQSVIIFAAGPAAGPVMVIMVFAVPAVPAMATVFHGHVLKLVAGPVVCTLPRLGRMHFARHRNRCAQRKRRAHAEADGRGHPHCPKQQYGLRRFLSSYYIL